MFVQTEPTPNPATLKFLPGREVMKEGTIFFQNQDSATNSPLADFNPSFSAPALKPSRFERRT